MELIVHVLEHSLWDTLELVPFLLVTYLAMEAIEHSASAHVQAAVERSGKAGPVVGAVLGALPQCGFSAMAATLYAGRVVTAGTLVAVILSTSDEMVPVLLAHREPLARMLAIVGAKLVAGVAVGLLVDVALRLWHRAGDGHLHIHELCEREHCHCDDEGHEHGHDHGRGRWAILRSALVHTVQVTFFIYVVTFAFGLLIELVGAMLLAIVFVPEFGVGQGVWYSVFHSISAFCNAGFDLMGVRAPYSSLVAYAGNPVVSLTIAGLIVVGGIGFLTWEDIRTNGLHLRAYRLQSKVILCVTFALIVLPAAYFYAFELSDALPVGERVLSALFQSITPRTAGFNTIDLTALSEVGQMVLVMLMLIGGSPGSTAGGMKTTTLAVLLFSAAAVFSRREEPRCFGRRIEGDALRNAAAILLLYLSLFLLGGLAISAMEDLPVVDCLFEAASAIGTVGLTLGLTPGLGGPSRAILIALMFFGRVGGLTLIFAALAGKRPCASKLPREKITVG